MTTVDHLIAVGEAMKTGAIVQTADGWYVRSSEFTRLHHLLPVDPLQDWEAPDPDDRYVCLLQDIRSGRRCARAIRHTGRHAAIEWDRIVAVWGSR